MNKVRASFCSLCICAAVLAAFSVQTSAQITTAQEFSGRATGLISVITTNGTSSTSTAGDTCPLPPRGGTSTVTSPGGPLIQGVLGSGPIASSTSGSGITSQSSSSVTSFALNAGGWTFRASNVTSSTQCNCCDISAPTCSAQSSVTGLTVTDASGANVTVTPNGTNNQVVTLPGGVGTITFNERISAGPGDLTVNAMHINITVGSTNYNVIVASSHSDIVCPGINTTAAEVDVSGHLVDSNGAPIPRATVTITNSQGVIVKSSTSDDSGAYLLSGIQSGSTYIVGASSKFFLFTPRTVNVLDEITGFNLVGVPRR